MAARFDARRTFLVGSLLWILVGIGHYVLVHALSLDSEAPWLAADPAVLDRMRMSEVDGGALGGNSLFRVFHGFSLWLGISMIGIGSLDLVLLRADPRPSDLRSAAWVNSALAAGFVALAFVDFVRPPQAGSVAILLCFGRALMRGETPPPQGG